MTAHPPHGLGWAAMRARERLAARALEAYPDGIDPPVDRSSLREKWVAAVAYLGDAWILAKPATRSHAG